MYKKYYRHAEPCRLAFAFMKNCTVYMARVNCSVKGKGISVLGLCWPLSSLIQNTHLNSIILILKRNTVHVSHVHSGSLVTEPLLGSSTRYPSLLDRQITKSRTSRTTQCHLSLHLSTDMHHQTVSLHGEIA